MRETISVLLLALLMSGCAAPSEAAEDRAAPADAPVQTASPENMSSSMVESTARPLSEAEILTAYEHAQLVYGWFDLAPLPTAEKTILLEGQVYTQVAMDNIADLEDLRTYLRSVFSRELTDTLLDGKTARIQYRDVNGALYTAGSARSPDAEKGGARIEVERLDDDSYSVNVIVDLLDESRENIVGLESWSFPYVFEGDRWVFTDFRLTY